MESTFISDIIQMLIIMLVITCAIFALIFLMKRYQYKVMSFQKTPQIKLLGMRHLGPKKSIAVVDVIGERLVLGLGGESITLLTKMDIPLEENQVLPEEDPPMIKNRKKDTTA